MPMPFGHPHCFTVGGFGVALACLSFLASIASAALVAAAMADAVMPWDEEPKFTAAFSQDDQCTAIDQQCTLSALQVHVVTKTLQVRKQREEGLANSLSLDGPCQHGLPGRLMAGATACVHACPQLCHSMAKAVNAFRNKGGVLGARRVLCREISQFQCALTKENAGKCRPAWEQVKKFGFELPSSGRDLQQLCR
mmetsp:Transcript_131550/g.328112  ORF Transcript_131550/g.328112 Transcript_131550/m.328112 type:complete len:195 (+) Transcript_131550:63-647(+)|eukprot:CAMPEP_0115430062 /NCGR_PEP_ID=MMETSP0271-20121206/30850_1 /TAXON_ID=71861 /ORGANISM="Scrippsiella trochoidea, Strain CCMP3099" /LENGTH=194 /DNA_ID=CAMNT_0002855277 /DNA_START=35 /DNA_END=619 /DNA_ORIENTATION=-